MFQFANMTSINFVIVDFCTRDMLWYILILRDPFYSSFFFKLVTTVLFCVFFVCSFFFAAVAVREFETWGFRLLDARPLCCLEKRKTISEGC